MVKLQSAIGGCGQTVSTFMAAAVAQGTATDPHSEEVGVETTCALTHSLAPSLFPSLPPSLYLLLLLSPTSLLPHLDKPLLKQYLCGLLQNGEQARVVDSNASLEERENMLHLRKFLVFL